MKRIFTLRSKAFGTDKKRWNASESCHFPNSLTMICVLKLNFRVWDRQFHPGTRQGDHLYRIATRNEHRFCTSSQLIIFAAIFFCAVDPCDIFSPHKRPYSRSVFIRDPNSRGRPQISHSCTQRSPNLSSWLHKTNREDYKFQIEPIHWAECHTHTYTLTTVPTPDSYAIAHDVTTVLSLF